MQHILFIFKEYRNIIIGLVFSLIFIWEHLAPERVFSKIIKHDITNIGFGLLNLTITFLGGYYFSMYLNWLSFHHVGLLNNLSGWWVIFLGLLIADVLMYWWHRFNHQVRFLWQFHALHHQDTMMNTTTAVRFHIAELFLSFIFRIIFYSIFGLGAELLLVFSSIHFIMIIFHHSNIRISRGTDLFIRKIITSPGMHRIHHSNKWNETNANYTSILSCWDWVFRSYLPNADGPIVFGIPEEKSNTL